MNNKILIILIMKLLILNKDYHNQQKDKNYIQKTIKVNNHLSILFLNFFVLKND